MNRLFGIALLFFVATPAFLRAQLPNLPTDNPTHHGAIDLQHASALFSSFSARENLAFDCPQEGCYARCQLMIVRLLDKGIQPRRIWAFSRPNTRLQARTSSSLVEWDWHVAPLVPVRVAAQVRWLVFDPCVLSRPAPIEEWVRALSGDHSPQFTVTQLGEPPIRDGVRLPGSGYWLRSDPCEGPGAHALRMLNELRRPMPPHIP